MRYLRWGHDWAGLRGGFLLAFEAFAGFGVLCVGLFASGATTYLPHQDRCVQYHVRKKMFLVKEELVWGINCEIAAEVQAAAGQVGLKMTIPVEKFSTGNEDRDEDVKNILKYAEHPRMTFVSEKMSLENLKAHIDQEKEIKVPGFLRIGGKDFPVSFQVSAKKDGSDFMFSGKLEATMSQLDIAPPRMAGGLIANVEDWVELSFNVHSRHVVGLSDLGLAVK